MLVALALAVYLARPAAPRAAGVRRRRAAAGRRAGRLPHGAVRPTLDLALRQHREPGVRRDRAPGRIPRPVVPAARGVSRPSCSRRPTACSRFRRCCCPACGGAISLPRRARGPRREAVLVLAIAAVDVPFSGRDEQLARRLVRWPALHRHRRAVSALAAGRALAAVSRAAGRRRRRRAGRPVGGAERRVGRALPALPRGVRQPGLRSGVSAARRRLHAVRRSGGCWGCGASRRWRRWPSWSLAALALVAAGDDPRPRRAAAHLGAGGGRRRRLSARRSPPTAGLRAAEEARAAANVSRALVAPGAAPNSETRR